MLTKRKEAEAYTYVLKHGSPERRVIPMITFRKEKKMNVSTSLTGRTVSLFRCGETFFHCCETVALVPAAGLFLSSAGCTTALLIPATSPHASLRGWRRVNRCRRRHSPNNLNTSFGCRATACQSNLMTNVLVTFSALFSDSRWRSLVFLTL